MSSPFRFHLVCLFGILVVIIAGVTSSTAQMMTKLGRRSSLNTASE